MLDGVANGDASEFGVDGVAGLPLLGASGENTPVGDCTRPCGDAAGERRGFLVGGWPAKDGMEDGLSCVVGEKVL